MSWRWNPYWGRLRSNTDIKDISIGDGEYKTAAFADDILLFLTELQTSIPVLLKDFELFHTLSNLKFNPKKSSELNISLSQETVERCEYSSFPFVWQPKTITYLGIDLGDLYTVNYVSLLNSIWADVSAWNKLGLSCLRKSRRPKDDSPSRLLYTMQTVPISLPPAFFAYLKHCFSSFLWQGIGDAYRS